MASRPPAEISVKELKEVLSKFDDKDIVQLSSWTECDGSCGALLNIQTKKLKHPINIMQEGDELF